MNTCNQLVNAKNVHLIRFMIRVGLNALKWPVQKIVECQKKEHVYSVPDSKWAILTTH